MKIATWNLHHDKGSAVWPQLHSALGADLIFLQESRRPNWSREPEWKNVPDHDWGSAVLTAKGTIRSISIRGYEGWVVGGELIDSGLNRLERSLFAFSVHSPTGNDMQPRQTYVDEVVKILGEIGRLLPSESDLIVGGDFNFKSLGDRTVGEEPKTTNEEKEALLQFKSLGLASCWAAAHPDRPLAQTLRWSGDKTPGRTVSYHCDGIFVPESWQVGIICEIFTSKCFIEASDHNPVMAWITR